MNIETDKVMVYLLSSNDPSWDNKAKCQQAINTLWSFGYRIIINRFDVNFRDMEVRMRTQVPDFELSFIDQWTVMLQMLEKCDVVYLIEGWDGCDLAKAEFTLAQMFNKDIRQDYPEEGQHK